MRIQTTLKFLIPFILLPQISQAALCSRVHSFSDGAILTASQLNTEFNNQIDCVNSVSDANVSASAAINPKKISPAIAGDGITRNGATGTLAVTTDGVTIETNSNALRIKDNGVSASKLKSDASVDANRAVTTDHIRDMAITAPKLQSDAAVDANRAVTTNHIRDGAITKGKLAPLPFQVTSKVTYSNVSGSPIDVPGLTATITATGRPVVITLLGDASGGSVSGSYGTTSVPGVSFKRGSTEVSNLSGLFSQAVATLSSAPNHTHDVSGNTSTPAGAHTHTVTQGSSQLNLPCSAFSHVDVPSPGSVTYSVRVSTGNTIDCKLAVYEL